MRAFLPAGLAIAAAAADDFPAPYNSHPEQSKPMPAAEAAAKMELPPGFKAQVFAAEPDVQNPIAMTWDGRGRLWIAENYTYAESARKFDLSLHDRILIFEDKNGDGHFSSRKVFTDTLQMLTSIEVGHGGVWAMCPPNLLFIPDRKGSDKPDAAPEVVLDGFTVPAENYHNFANGLRFGPDGWLYGRCGGSAPGEVGAPGTPPDQRLPLRGGMWRYHPERKVFETITAGLTNPWGHDWNEFGELFNVNTVNGHLWHDFAGAHFVRGSTVDPNPHVYSLIDTHADHWHFDTGKSWTNSRAGAANSYGGGHSHIGAMVYLGDNWPAEYRGRLYTLNQHGRRANEELLERTGSGYVAHRGKDTMLVGGPLVCRPRSQLRPGWRGVRPGLERHRRMPRAQRDRPHQRTHLQDHLLAIRSARTWETCPQRRRRNWLNSIRCRTNGSRAAPAWNSLRAPGRDRISTKQSRRSARSSIRNRT